MKNIRRILAIIMSVLIAISLFGCSFNLKERANNIKVAISDFTNDVIEEAEQFIDSNNSKLSITMLDVGQGLSVLIESNGEYLLYDGGDRGASSYVVSYLKNHGIEELKYVIASHYDSDHIAGLVGVLETTEVVTVINPAYKTSTKIYESYINKVSESNAEVIYPSVGDVYKLGYSTITILAPAKDYGDSNEMSIAVKITCGDFDCIITGDAEKESEEDMLNCGVSLDAELYVVGHHGSSSSSSDAFVSAISPNHAFVSCGKDNDYGHPHKETIDTLNKYSVSVFRTDLHGELTCLFDGNEYEITQEVQ